MSIYLKEIRKEKGYTQEQVCKKINLNLRTYQRYESGKRIPPANVLSKILEVLGYERTAKEISHLLEQVE